MSKNIEEVIFACETVLNRELTEDEKKVLEIAYRNGRRDGIEEVENHINGF